MTYSKNLEKIKELKKEIVAILAKIDKFESNLWNNGELISAYIEISVMGELLQYFQKQLKEINEILLLKEKKSNVNNKKLEEILERTGNLFLLEYGNETLVDNIYRTYLKIDSDEFRFSGEYIEKVISKITDNI